MKNILLTGSGGRLGSKVAKCLSDLGFPLTLLTSRQPDDKLINAKYIQVNWRKLEVPPLDNIDVVIHLAHQTSAYEARKNVELDIQTNLISTIRIVESLKHSAIPPHFIYMGSLTEYGSNNLNPIVELDQTAPPETFYDCSKLAVELYLKQYQNENLLGNLTLIRLGNLYGFLESFKKRHRGFFDEAIYSAFQGKEVTCFGDGEYFRDFIHVDDVLDALVCFIQALEKSSDGLFNLATGKGYTLKNALNSIGDSLVLAGLAPIKLKFEEFPKDAYAIECRNHIADISLVKESIGWSPKTTLSHGISRSIHYYLKELNSK